MISAITRAIRMKAVKKPALKIPSTTSQDASREHEASNNKIGNTERISI